MRKWLGTSSDSASDQQAIRNSQDSLMDQRNEGTLGDDDYQAGMTQLSTDQRGLPE